MSCRHNLHATEWLTLCSAWQCFVSPLPSFCAVLLQKARPRLRAGWGGSLRDKSANPLGSQLQRRPGSYGEASRPKQHKFLSTGPSCRVQLTCSSSAFLFVGEYVKTVRVCSPFWLGWKSTRMMLVRISCENRKWLPLCALFSKQPLQRLLTNKPNPKTWSELMQETVPSAGQVSVFSLHSSSCQFAYSYLNEHSQQRTVHTLTRQ